MAKVVKLPEKTPIPTNWLWVDLGKLSETLSGYPFDSQLFSTDANGRRPLIRIRDVVRGYTETFTSEECSDEYVIHKGDILIGMDGDFNVQKWAQEDALLNQRVCTIKSTSDLLSNDFLFYYLPQPLKYINQATPSVTVKHLSTKTIAKIPFPLPPRAEQERIVAAIEELFGKLDAAEEKLRTVIADSPARRAALLRRAFTGALTAKWRAAHGRSLDEWRETELKSVCTVNPKKIDVKNLSDDLVVSFIPMAAVSEETGAVVAAQTRLLKDVKKGFTNFSEGDVVFAKITPCMENGKSAIIGELINHIGFGTTEFYVLRVGDLLDNRYLYHLVRSTHFRAEAKNHMTGAVGQQRVPKSFMEEYKFYLPPLDEQREIVRLLDELLAQEDAASAAAEATLAKIPALRQAVLTRAFRGQLGTNDPAEPPALSE